MGLNFSNTDQLNSASTITIIKREKPRPARALPWCPIGIACDIENDHRILVADIGSNNIRVFSRHGQRLKEFGSKGNKPGQFYCPNKISIQSITNHIVVSDNLNSRIQVLDSQGQFVTMFGKELLKYPNTVDCSHYPNQQQHIVTADLNHKIRLFSSSTNNNNRYDNKNTDYQLLRSFGSFGMNINQIGIVRDISFDDERKRILIADYLNYRISVWSNDGSQFLYNIPMLYSNDDDPRPCSVSVDHYNHYGSHYMVVGTDRSKIYIYDTRMEQQEGKVVGRETLLQTIGSQGTQRGQFRAHIWGVCINDKGDLLATDYWNQRVQIFHNSRSSSMISLLASSTSSTQTSIPQKQPPVLFKKNAPTIPNVYNSFLCDNLFDKHLIREVVSFLPPYNYSQQ